MRYRFFNTDQKPKGEVVSFDMPAPLTESDLPEGMPLTNRLDKMTRAQATWAIENGDAWIAYLKANAGEVYQHQKSEPNPQSDADKYKSICDLLENVWLDLTDNMKRGYLTPAQKIEWVATLEWAIKALPEGYEIQREIFQDELAEYQPTK